MSMAQFTFDNSYARELEGFYLPWQASPAPAPKLIKLNSALAAELGLEFSGLGGDALARLFTGNDMPEGASPLAQAYAGHQFGGFTASLGDGRALLIGEVIDRNGQRRDIQLKGSGRTPFSRGGDGRAAIGPVLREYLIGEAMHKLGIPTTRALAAVATGAPVMRQEGPLSGAVLTRVAASHIRVGTFQFFAARGDFAKVRQLAAYALARHYPQAEGADNPALALMHCVVAAQAALIARWMLNGFIHGVMNTDNMAISGETIDYGPCAFMEAHEPETVFSAIDRQGRYAYGNQPFIAHWNLARLAETFVPLADTDKDKAVSLLTDAIDRFPQLYQRCWLDGMRAKTGLARAEAGDLSLMEALLEAARAGGADHTLLFRRLSDAALGRAEPARALFSDPARFDLWLARWRGRLAAEDAAPDARAAAMDRVNPVYIPRNHKVEEALEAAIGGNLAPFETLLEVIEKPFDERVGLEEYASPAPKEFGHYRTFCGT